MRRLITTGIKILLITCFLEATVFNYKYYATCGNQEKVVSAYNVSDALHATDTAGVYDVWADEDVTIEIPNINCEVNSIRVGIHSVLPPDAKPVKVYREQKTDVEIYANDVANQQYFKLGSRCTLKDVPASQYYMLHLAGKTNIIHLELEDVDEPQIAIDTIVINPRIPFHISGLRMLLTLLLISFVCACRPGSELYQIPYDAEKRWKKCVDVIVVLVAALLFTGLVHMNPMFEVPQDEYYMQYQELARAFSEGRVSLMEEPSKELVAMDNPYDTEERVREGVTFLWDRAYFQGHYYVYFGVVPVLLYYLPGLLLTGNDMPTHLGMLIAGIMLLIGLMKLLNALIKRYFRETSYLLYLMMLASFSAGCGLLYMMVRPDFYSFPILLGIDFSIWGLFFWLTAIKEGTEEVCNWRLCAGSFCMALVAGCRPQFLIISFVAVVLFWRIWGKKKRFLFGKLSGTIAFVVPYLLVAAGLMYYNAIRFGSAFDFGANYNLTSNDMRHRGFELGRICSGLFTYLFQLPDIGLTFPFICTKAIDSVYLGKSIAEETMGGILTCNSILLVLLLIPRCKGILKKSSVFGITCFSAISGLIIILADTQMAGILPRYYNDFAWLFFLAAACMIFAVDIHLRKAGNPALQHIWRMYLMIAMLCGYIYNFLRMFVDITETLDEYHPDVFYDVAYSIAFWM